MQTQTRVFITMGILMALILGLYVFSDWFSKVTGYILGDDQGTRLIKCLNKNNTVLYTEDNCKDCYEQQQIIGDKAYALLNVVNCGKVKCNFKQFPAWEIDGKIDYGKKTLNELASLSGCPFEKS